MKVRFSVKNKHYVNLKKKITGLLIYKIVARKNMAYKDSSAESTVCSLYIRVTYLKSGIFQVQTVK